MSLLIVKLRYCSKKANKIVSYLRCCHNFTFQWYNQPHQRFLKEMFFQLSLKMLAKTSKCGRPFTKES